MKVKSKKPTKYGPGTMDRFTIETLGDLQSEFLNSITASEETAKKARLAWPDWTLGETIGIANPKKP